jgi:hypothetical protein
MRVHLRRTTATYLHRHEPTQLLLLLLGVALTIVGLAAVVTHAGT